MTEKSPRATKRKNPFAWPSVGVSFFIFTALLAMSFSPAGKQIDRALHGPWVEKSDGWIDVLLRTYLDRIVEQEVLGLGLLGAVILLVLTKRSLFPLVVYLATQLFFGLTAVVKIAVGKTYPPLGAPKYNYGGWDRADFTAMALPSGHATTAFILSGCLLILLATYAHAHWARYGRWYCRIWTAIVGVALLTSLLLGYHWFMDLAVGSAWGMLGVSLLLAGWTSGYFESTAAWCEKQSRLPFFSISKW